jgi:hypothetical protein
LLTGVTPLLLINGENSRKNNFGSTLPLAL